MELHSKGHYNEAPKEEEEMRKPQRQNTTAPLQLSTYNEKKKLKQRNCLGVVSKNKTKQQDNNNKTTTTKKKYYNS